MPRAAQLRVSHARKALKGITDAETALGRAAEAFDELGVTGEAGECWQLREQLTELNRKASDLYDEMKSLVPTTASQ